MVEKHDRLGGVLSNLNSRGAALPLAILGVGMVMLMTRYGPGASGDSSSYLMGAQNLLAGHGFYRFSGGFELKPITGFPPGFSLALAGMGVFIRDLYAASRFLNALLMGANLLLAAWLIHRTTRSWLAAVVGQALILMSSTQIVLHAWVMSEPLYIFFSLITLGCLAWYLEQASAWPLVAAAAAAGAGVLTRYAGLSLVGVGLLVIVLVRSDSLRRRIAHAAMFGLISLAPIAVWTQRNAALAGTRVDRQLAYHIIPSDLVRLFLAEISSWFVPHEVPLPTVMRALLAFLIAAALIGGFIWLSRARLHWRVSRLQIDMPTGAGGSLPWLILLYLASYAAVLVANSALLDASTTATAPARYLAPAFVALAVLSVDAAHALLSRAKRVGIWGTLTGAYLLVLLAYNLTPTLAALSDPFPWIGYTARRVTWADTVALMHEYEGRAPLVSNNPEMVYILTGEPAYVRPISYDQYQEAPRADYQDQLVQITAILEQGSVLVVFKPVEPDDARLIDYAGLAGIGETQYAKFYAEPDVN